MTGGYGQNIEIETLGVKCDNYTLPEYKEAIKVTSELQEQAIEMQKQAKKDKRIVDKLMDKLLKTKLSKEQRLNID